MNKLKKVTIHVTAEDIRDGDYPSNCDCAIGRAIRRTLPGARYLVGGLTITINGVCRPMYDVSPRLYKASIALSGAYYGGPPPRPFWFRFPVERSEA